MKGSLLYMVSIFLLSVSHYSYSQESQIAEIADKACECTKEISVDFVKDTIIKKINDCIILEITEKQTYESIAEMKKTADSLIALSKPGDTVTANANGKTHIINISKNFEAIQGYMHYNCSYVKRLMGSNNTEYKYSISKDEKALELYYEGIYLGEDGKYEAAIEKYKQALKIDNKFSFAWDNMGLCYRKLDNYKEAIKCYEKSLKLDPGGKTPLKNMAVAYSMMNNLKKASVHYEEYIKLYPDDPEGYYGASRTYYKDGNYAIGVDYILKAYKLYLREKSPYINDAQEIMVSYYKNLKEKGKLDIFLKAAENNNIDIAK